MGIPSRTSKFHDLLRDARLDAAKGQAAEAASCRAISEALSEAGSPQGAAQVRARSCVAVVPSRTFLPSCQKPVHAGVFGALLCPTVSGRARCSARIASTTAMYSRWSLTFFANLVLTE